MKVISNQKRLWLPIAICLLVSMSGCNRDVYPFIDEQDASAWRAAFITIAVVAGLILIQAVINRNRRKAKHARLADKVNHSLSFLADGLDDHDSNVREESMVRMAAYLDTAPPEELTGLGDSQKQTIYNQLLAYDAVLSRSILRAVERCGELDALPYLNRMVKRLSVNESNPLYADAVHCLDIIARLADDRKHARELLRPSDPIGVDEDLLLRPSAMASEAPSRLLRPK